MKNKILLITALFILSVLLLNAQDKKKVQVKVLKSENGKTIKLDTTFESTEHGDVYFYSDGEINQEKIDSILESLDIDAEHGVKFISKNLDSLDSEKVKHIWISATGDDEFDLDKHAIIELIDGEKVIETTDEFTIIEGDSVKITKKYIYHSGDEKVYVTKKDGKKVLVSTSAHSGSYVWNVNDLDAKVITITDDIDLLEDSEGNVKIISTTSSDSENEAISEIIVKRGDGNSKTIEVYIDEDEFDGETKIIELEEALGGKGENVKIVKYKTDDGKIVVKAELSEECKKDKEIKTQKLKIIQGQEKGVFNIEFKLEEKEPTFIIVENKDGESVYSKKLKKFDGVYSGKIDLSKEPDGTYTLQIIQDEKRVIQKELKK